ncbi:MAG: TadE/TadG family type IV pilus assembly protein [Pseudomonadota bacterium]|nr:TadE/TadG family type IV pilus assembly protein [Pseudomonadota bacterium]
MQHGCSAITGQKPRSAQSGLLARLSRDRAGSSAIEFGLVAAPFFALLMAIIEVTLVFFGGFTLENAVDRAGRLIRTGQAQTQGFNQQQFKDTVCAQVYALFDCAAQLKVEVLRFPTFNGINLPSPTDGSGNLKNDFGYDPGNGGDVVVVRVFYEWSLIANLPGAGLGNMPNGSRLLVATTTFRNEPFDN